MLKTYQGETKLFEFSRDTNGKELMIGKYVTLQWLHFVMACLCQTTTSHCNVCLPFEKAEEKKKKKKNE